MPSNHSIKQTLYYFKDRRLLSIFCFGIASGFPWVMIGSAMSGWLKDEGLSRSSIGLFGLIFVAYSINFLWSPLVDRLKIPLLTNNIGQRRSWILSAQFLMLISAVLLSQLDASKQLNLMALFGLFIATTGATQDIAIDAYRIDSLSDKDSNYMAAGSAMATAGWWTGYAGLGSIPFILVDLPDWHWPQVYLVLAAIMGLLMLTAIIVAEPKSYREQAHKLIEQNYLQALTQHGNKPLSILLILPLIMGTIFYANIGYPAWPEQLIDNSYRFTCISLFILTLLIIFSRQLIQLNKSMPNTNCHSHSHEQSIEKQSQLSYRLTAWLLSTMVAPIQEFFQRNGTKLACSILLFIFLFKLGEAYLGRMSIVFYREVGFSNSDIAYYSKMINWGVTIIFSLIGSVFTIRYGILKGLFIGGIAMASSNLLFALMALVGPDKALFAFTVFVDGFTSAWGSVAFVALLSVLCNKTFTASQYALMASLGTFGRVMLGSYSGIMVDWLDGNWAIFFVLTALMVLPSLLFLYTIRKPLTALIEKS
jgi:PAT family beta-lactamase induction signal transducer AmpG